MAPAPDNPALAPDSEPGHRAWEALQQQFVQRLPARVARIRAAASPAEALAEWHRLAGAAGSFGHAPLSALAHRTLAACRGDPPDPSAQDQLLAAALAELEAAAAGLGVGPGG
ncbi:MAG: hypothetical protein RL375_2011 [Pseudomonadota bacterium]